MSDNAEKLLQWAVGQVTDPSKQHVSREAADQALGFDYATRRGAEEELQEAGLIKIVNTGHFRLIV